MDEKSVVRHSTVTYNLRIFNWGGLFRVAYSEVSNDIDKSKCLDSADVSFPSAGEAIDFFDNVLSLFSTLCYAELPAGTTSLKE
jgi:hypothetical protein